MVVQTDADNLPIIAELVGPNSPLRATDAVKSLISNILFGSDSWDIQTRGT